MKNKNVKVNEFLNNSDYIKYTYTSNYLAIDRIKFTQLEHEPVRVFFFEKATPRETV